MPLLETEMPLTVTDREARASAANFAVPAEQLPLPVPENSPFDRRAALLLFVGSFAYLSLFLRYTAIEPDEGIILQGAQRILHGEVLYRDFFSYLTPGSYYLLALLFKVFGNSFAVARMALVCSGPVFSVVNYLLARRVCSRGAALTVAILVTLTTLPYRFLVLHNWDSTLWACLAVYCAVRLLDSAKWKWGFGAGSFASLTFVFEQSKGTGLCLGLGLGFLVIAWMGRPKSFLTKAQLAGIALGFAWPLGIVLMYFAANHALPAMLADWFWPLRYYSLANRVPYGYQNWSDHSRYLLFGTGPAFARFVKILAISPGFLVPVLPLIGIGLFLYWIAQIRRNRAAPAKCAYYVLLTATFSGLLFSVVMVRADIIHFMYLLPLFGLVLAWVIDGRDIPGRAFQAVRPYLRAYIVIAFAVMAMPLLMRAIKATNKVVTRRGVVALPAKDTVIEYVQEHVTPGESILVYPYLPLYYYLTETSSPTRFEYFQPGMNTASQAAEIVQQLASRRVRVVLFESSFADKISTSWPRTPLSAIANDPVADYIAREYRNCTVLRSPTDWHFIFMIRKDLACP
jgi:4-amino-4-deoxy-L-arabinose transferase-like glycosyltransferase